MKSNRTDNDSAKMATSKGVIQGYTGMAAVDARHQIIVDAQAHGTGSEQELLVPVVKAIKNAPIETPLITDASLITADAGYHSESNLKQLAGLNVEALIADNGMRQRDDRFKDQSKHKQHTDPLYDKSGRKKAKKMKARIDSAEGRIRYGRRFATVEPVFGNLRHNKQLNRFTLRRQNKVDAQWKLYCPVHSIEKLAHHGYAQ